MWEVDIHYYHHDKTGGFLNLNEWPEATIKLLSELKLVAASRLHFKTSPGRLLS